jgi:CheY-like chemotaxis protein
MPEGGTITVNCENVIVRAGNNLMLKAGNYVKLSLKDQGAGISDQHLPRIFDPYFTTKQKGSGLGLSTTYSIIKKHAGHINVESKIGVGSALNIYLPASMEKVSIKKTVEDEPIHGTGKVLIMDDDELVRDSLGQILIGIGYVVEFACDGREAVDIYKNAMASDHRFDAVIMDLIIPGGMGGKEAVRELIKIDPHVKAIVSSGYSYNPIMANYSDYGFSAVLTKPYKDIRELNRILNNVIDGE